MHEWECAASDRRFPRGDEWGRLSDTAIELGGTSLHKHPHLAPPLQKPAWKVKVWSASKRSTLP